MVFKNNQIAEYVDRIPRLVSDHLEIHLIYLFGSAVSGHHHAESDLDVAILIDNDFYQTMTSDLEYQAGLVVQLQRLFETDRVDLVLLNQATPLLANQVVTTGTLLYCKDQREKTMFIVRSKQRYLDTKPLRAIKRRYLYARIDRGEFSQVTEP